MKLRLALCLFATSAAAFAAETFPGVKSIMTPEEYARAGLDHLTSDQIGVIDAAIIKHYAQTVNVQAKQAAQQIVEEKESRSWIERFGLPDLSFSQDWKDKPSIKAHCTGWVGGNSFKLDNGQVWEGLQETITIDVAGKDVEITARPGGFFALTVEGKNTTIRVHRIK
jgi:hypothetical protein